MSENSFKRILIIQTAFIGDILLATGVIEKLHTFYPISEIDILIKKENRTVLVAQPYIKEVILFNKEKKWSEIIRLLGKIRAKKYDLVVNLHRHLSSGILTAFSNSKVTVGFNKNPLSFLFTGSFPHKIGETEDPIHEVERNHTLIAGFTDEVFAKPKLHLKEIDFNVIKLYQKTKYICIAPASIWFTKQLPEEKWGELIKLIPEDLTIHLIGAVGDISLCERIRNNSRRNNVKVLAGSLTLNQSAALMKGAVLNFVNDSAPLHLASSVNAPVCVVYCSTIPAFGFGPLSSYSKIVEIDYLLECRPCNLHGFKSCPQGHFKCAKDIKSSELLKALEGATQIQ